MILAALRLARLRLALGRYTTVTLVVYLVTLAGREFTLAIPAEVHRYLAAFAAGAFLLALGWLGWVAFLFAAGAR